MAEIENRLERFRRLALVDGLEAAIIQNPENRAYLSGFEGSAGSVLVTLDAAYLLVDFRYLEQAQEQAAGLKVILHQPEITSTLGVLLAELGVKNLGWEKSFVTLEQRERWESRLEGVVLQPIPDYVSYLRMVKEEEEIGLIRRAAAIADQAFAMVRPAIRPGAVEREVAIELEYAMRRLGADRYAFDTIVASGPRSAMPHARASERVMGEGDLVIVDFGAVYNCYCSDCTRTLVLGEMSEQQREVYQTVRDAQEAALRFIRPGVKASQVDQVARDFIARRGYGKYFGHSLGHGVGRGVHEEPTLSFRDETILEPGMVVTVEPGIYIPDWGGVRIEDLVLVTPSGAEVLTSAGGFA